MRSKNPETMNKIIKFVESYFSNNGVSPSIRLIATELGISVSTAHKYLHYMNETGQISYDGSDISTDVIKKHSKMFTKAAVLDNGISCGKPEYEEEHINQYVMLPTALFGEGEFYILTASGDSMINAGIDNGDTIIVKKQNEANYGDIIVALADGQNTLKTYAYDNEFNRVMLQPENDSYEPIYPDELYIQGVAIDVIKSLKR